MKNPSPAAAASSCRLPMCPGRRSPAESAPQRAAPGWPEVSELDLVRHFTNLSRRNFSVDTNFYPLGSCTMKYNAKVHGKRGRPVSPFHPMTALLPGGEELARVRSGMLYDLGELLAEITGMDEVTTQPLAGAHGEMTGIMLIAAYHAAKGNKAKKKYVVVPDSSHGTNPASAAMAGYEIITVPTAPYGDMDLELFKAAMTDEVAAVMMTCPNTLGLFNPHIKEICDIAHSHDALMYYDGANLNAIMGKVKPGGRRLRRDPCQPAQDLRHPPRRRRSRERPGRRQEGADPVSAAAAHRQG